MLTMILVLIVGIGAIVGTIYYNKKRRDAMIALAVKLGWTDIPDTNSVFPFVPFSLTGLGIREGIDIAFSLPLNNQTSTLFHFSYVTETTTTDANGNSQRSEQTHRFTVLNSAAPGVEGRVHMHHRGFMNLERELLFPGLRRLQVEGELNKRFDIFVPDGQQIEALQALEPDVMEIILDHGTEFSLDIANERLSIIADGDYITAEKIPALLAYADALLKKID